MRLWTRFRRMFGAEMTAPQMRAPGPDELDRRVAEVRAKAERALQRGRLIDEVRRIELHVQDRGKG